MCACAGVGVCMCMIVCVHVCMCVYVKHSPKSRNQPRIELYTHPLPDASVGGGHPDGVVVVSGV